MAVSGDLAGSVQYFRQRAGLSQRAAAELEGLSLGGLRDIEQGRVVRLRASTLRKLGEVFGLSHYEINDLVHQAGIEYGQVSGLKVEILGSLRISVDGRPIGPGSEAQHVLLGLLALTPNVSVPRGAPVDALWNVRPAYGTVDLLQARVSRLRRNFQPTSGDQDGPQPIPATRTGYQLTVSEYQHDLLAFRRLVTRARHARGDGDLDAACDLFADAIALWRGDPLDGIIALQTHLTVLALIREYRAVVVEYASTAVDLGRYHDMLPLLQQAAEADPLHELLHAALMIALAGCGQQAAALDIFNALRRRLVWELGADPSSELTAAYQRVLRQKVSRPESIPIRAQHQLPPDIADFTGRRAEIRQLSGGLSDGKADTSVPIFVIKGMAGIGKTRLAVHVAHRLWLGGRFGDSQLYVNLRGHDVQPPANPASVLATFLRLLGVPGEQVPPGLDERTAMYRDRLYGRDTVIILDNAASDDQALPLLPAGPANLVLLTTKRTLALDGARTLLLPTFTPAEADEVLIRAVGATRVQAEPDATRKLGELCGHLPLALALAAHRLQSRPGWTIADLADRLESAEDRLDEFAAGSRPLRSEFELSYRSLGAAEQQAFRLLGRLPRDVFTGDSVAGLLQTTSSCASHLLDHLADENLLTAVARNRYRLHGSLADYAFSLLPRRHRTYVHRSQLLGACE
ncbi:helix-turn-helix domain-containing protein [Nocardia uniformis]|uniref:Helix-turn-helix domain-containing protein n=1 Tax=Nocardia uniformis TaxID=53432 RepID=A0A849BU90_9NOCA|nr:BTAD domain-containing putative transcriptional regulator [Nocardia uniformis]NNH70173.1 helix-turn-helix domain-containing protein [Nocardia uniformis]